MKTLKWAQRNDSDVHISTGWRTPDHRAQRQAAQRLMRTVIVVERQPIARARRAGELESVVRVENLRLAVQMRTNENRGPVDRGKLRYPSDLTGEQWALVAPAPLERSSPTGRTSGDAAAHPKPIMKLARSPCAGGSQPGIHQACVGTKTGDVVVIGAPAWRGTGPKQ